MPPITATVPLTPVPVLLLPVAVPLTPVPLTEVPCTPVPLTEVPAVPKLLPPLLVSWPDRPLKPSALVVPRRPLPAVLVIAVVPAVVFCTPSSTGAGPAGAPWAGAGPVTRPAVIPAP